MVLFLLDRLFIIFFAIFQRFTVEELTLEHAYLVDLNVSVCTESAQACEQDYIITKNVILPKKQCDWDAGFVDPSKSHFCQYSILSKLNPEYRKTCVNQPLSTGKPV